MKTKNKIVKLLISSIFALSIITTPVIALAAPPKYHCGIQMQYTSASWNGSYNHYHGLTQYLCRVTYTDTAYYYTCANCGTTQNETERSNEIHTRV